MSPVWFLQIVAAGIALGGGALSSASELGAAGAPSPLVPGDVAPEWKVIGWSDGTVRTVADFRGKVLVIDFWGDWCQPCIRLIPVLKKLEQKFGPQGVDFVSIHTAGSTMDRIKVFLKRNGWLVPAGVDAGDSALSGATTLRYGVIGFPTLVVVGRDGRIVFSSSADMLPSRRESALQEYKEIAEELKIPWPIENSMDLVVLDKQLGELAFVLYSRKIVAAVGMDKPAQ